MQTSTQTAEEMTVMPDEEILMQMEADEKNARNAYCAVGYGGGAAPEFLTPTQVRHMSRHEVRDQYALISESMKHWQ